jgi:hypothetical protein
MLGAERAAAAVRVSLGEDFDPQRLPEVIALFFQALRTRDLQGSCSA